MTQSTLGTLILRCSPKFELGQVVSTQGALAACQQEYLQSCLIRHVSGDFGTVCLEDWQTNVEAITSGDRILSAYPIDPALPCNGFGENCLWIITESDRSVTTFHLPDEY